MAFNLIVPTVKPKTASFRIATVKSGGGAYKVQIAIPSAHYELLFPKAERFDLLLGDGSDKGKLMIRPAEEGHFKPTMLKRTALFRLPVTDDTPQIEISTENPERREVQGGGIVITLPDWMEPERWRAIQKAKAQVAREREAESKRVAR